jgi:hypothetical protein
VDDIRQLALEERQQPFSLTQQQIEDSDLSSAIVIIRRATQAQARDHDIRVFRVAIRDAINSAPPRDPQFNAVQDVPARDDSGEGMVGATAAAVATLDGQGYRSGYVMVVGLSLYTLLYTRATGAVDLPVVAVRGLLGDGPIYRSTVLPPDEALVLSVGAGRIDRAVAVPPSAEFLRIERARDEGRDREGGDELRVFRLFERFITRFKESRSAVLLHLAAADRPPAGDGGGEPAGDDGGEPAGDDGG